MCFRVRFGECFRLAIVVVNRSSSADSELCLCAGSLVLFIVIKYCYKYRPWHSVARIRIQSRRCTTTCWADELVVIIISWAGGAEFY